jgi:hypothetical protein
VLDVLRGSSVFVVIVDPAGRPDDEREPPTI